MLSSRQKFAFRSVQHWQRLIKNQGSLVNAIVGDSCIHVDQHYPLDDWRSPCTTFQGFYHCHRADGSREHGHIHLFKRFDGIGLVHLFAISFDNKGLPLSFFNVSPKVASDKGLCPLIRASVVQSGVDSWRTFADKKLSNVLFFIINLIGMYSDEIGSQMAQEPMYSMARCGKEVMWIYNINWMADLAKL